MSAKAARKSAGKSAKRRPRGRPFTGADDPRNGKGPAPGAPNAGRPPDEFKAMCAGLASWETTVSSVTTILESPEHQHFMKALAWAAERGYGSVAHQHEHSGPGGAPIAHHVTVTRRLVRPGESEP